MRLQIKTNPLSPDYAMFNEYRTSYSSYTDVKVNQQPHDAADAARLYGELRDRAISDVEKTVVNRLPGIDVEYCSYLRSFDTYNCQYRIMFKVNGEIIVSNVEISEFDKMNNIAGEKVAMAIAGAVMEKMGYDIGAICRYYK